MNNDVETNNRNRAQLTVLEKYGLLLMGIFLLILSGGRFVTPAAAFLAPIFLLRFTRNSSVNVGIAVLYVLLFLSLLVRLHDYIDVSQTTKLFLVAGFALIEVAPFFIDRKLFNKLPAILAPLVLSCAFVVLSFIAVAVMPFGSMGEKAYTQVGNNELVQMLTITGPHGITFVIFWFAATMATFWDSGFSWRRCRSQVVLMSLCVMIIFVAGGFRNIFDENESSTVRIAGVVGNRSALAQGLRDNKIASIKTLTGAEAALEPVSALLTNHHDDLFARTIAEASAGAEIVAWAEADGVIVKSAEPAFIVRAASVAKDAGIYLVATLFVIDDSTSSVSTAVNKLVVFSPEGRSLGQYTKTRPLWNDHIVSSDNEVLLLDTEFGKIAFAIGFDLDFPTSMRAAGSADIIIAPSLDWKTLSPHHSLMATFRGVENGSALFRPTSYGQSIASDSHGRILAQSDHFRTSPHTLVANVPTRGVTTFYSSAGDWFGWLNVGLLLILLSVFFWRQRNGDQLAESLIDSDETNADAVRDRSRITAIQWRDSQRDNNLDKND